MPRRDYDNQIMMENILEIPSDQPHQITINHLSSSPPTLFAFISTTNHHNISIVRQGCTKTIHHVLIIQSFRNLSIQKVADIINIFDRERNMSSLLSNKVDGDSITGDRPDLITHYYNFYQHDCYQVIEIIADVL